MTERFEKSYNSLVRAFFEGTLAKGTCTACACGNIIFDAIGNSGTPHNLAREIEFNQSDNNYVGFDDVRARTSIALSLWASKREPRYGGYYVFDQYAYVVNEAGYTGAEFAKIENAFEGNTRIAYYQYNLHNEQEILEDQYKGLCAVVDVLIELDEANENPDELKAKFREHPKLVTA